MNNKNEQKTDLNMQESRGLVETQYHGNGKMKKFIEYFPDGTISYISEFDESENGIKYTKFNSDGNIDFWKETEWDQNGNAIKCTVYNADGSINSWRESKYDENGKEVNQTFYNSDGTIKLINEFE